MDINVNFLIRRPQRLMRLAEVKHLTGLCRSSIYARIACGEFPVPRKLGRISFWLESEINKWIDGVATKREGGNQ